MNEKQTSVRPTKKQRELLTFIDGFIAEHGYSPSYREIMSGLDYTSVATVALHVNNLIKRGHLRKRDYSARSLELVKVDETVNITTNQVIPSEEKWLVDRIEHAFSQVEQEGTLTSQSLEGLNTLIATLRILGMDGAAQSFASRLARLKKQSVNEV